MPGVNDPHPNEQLSDTAVAEAEQPAVADPEDFFGPEQEEGEDEVVVEEAPEVEAEPEAAAEPAAAEPQAEAAAPAEPQEEGVKADAEEDDKGNKREYVVLQEIVLDQDMLQEMLKQVKGGVEPVVALIEVHRASVTTQKAAFGAAWKAHGESWEAPPRLAAVSANKLKVRTMKVKTREVTGFEFE